MLRLAFPALLLLVAEPITGLVDTYYVKDIDAATEAGLGIGVALMGPAAWLFAFLGTSIHTEVAQARGDGDRVRMLWGASLWMAIGLGLLASLLGWWVAPALARDGMAANGDVLEAATTYLRIRWVGFPLLLILFANLGTLRGLVQLRAAVVLAVIHNACNAVLDPILINGWGPVPGLGLSIPALGIAGAGWATVLGQGVGAFLATLWVSSRVARGVGSGPTPLRRRLPRLPAAGELIRLLKIGGALMQRTAFLSLFLMASTRFANDLGELEGAAWHGIRQMWIFASLAMDAFAIAVQSLVAVSMGRGDVVLARRAAAYSVWWTVGTAVALSAVALVCVEPAARALVAEEAHDAFYGPWLLTAATLALSALAFATDGVHVATRDYGFLRNGMLLSTGLGLGCLTVLSIYDALDLNGLCLVTAGWVGLRGLLGALRVWPGRVPGMGGGPLAGPLESGERAGPG